ncbi:hypothetical protein QYM36_017993, partial [Artemia franciscana]
IECGDLVNVNQYIASKLPGRTGEGVKKFRKLHDYLEILEDVRRRATDGGANLVSPPNKRYRTIEPLNASEVMEQIEDGDEALFRSHSEVSVPQFEAATLEAKSFRTTALLAVEGKISVDTLFRKFSERYLKSAREERMTCGGGRGGGRSGNRQEPAKDTKAKRKAMFNRSEKDCLDAILSVNGFEREEVTLISTEKDALLGEYKDLFESDPLEDKERFVPSVNKLGTEVTCPISPKEVSRTLNSFDENSAPGPDLIKYSTLKGVDNHVSAALFNAFTGCSKIASCLKPRGTTLVPKNLGPGLPGKKFRPITIGSAISRLYTKIFVNRLNAYELLSVAQRGFHGKKRSIAILAIDLAKAFDSVQHTSVQRALNRFGASDHLRRIVEDLYTDVDTRLSVGRQQLGHIIMRNGVKQGDPLSPFLFNLVLDEFLTNVNSDPTVTQGIGFQYGRVKVAATGYADDLLLIAETRHGAQLLMDGLTTFCTNRHLRINPSKCQSLCLEWQGKAKSHEVLGSIVSCCEDREQESSMGEGSVHVPAVSVTGSLSYLGTQIRPDGNCEVKEAEFASSLAKLRRTP